MVLTFNFIAFCFVYYTGNSSNYLLGTEGREYNEKLSLHGSRPYGNETRQEFVRIRFDGEMSRRC